MIANVISRPVKLVLSPFKALLSKLPPMPSTPPPHTARRSTLIQLSVLIGVAVSFHFWIADISIAGFAFAIFSLKSIIVFRRLSPPPKLLMMILTIVSLGLVIYVYGGWNGQRAGISFLVLLVSLKFLESEALRDYFVVCLLLYFLAASSFLFDSSMLSIAIVVVYTVAITSILLQLSNPAKVSLKANTALGASIVVRALPLAIILFFFFPRIQGDFGILPSLDPAKDAAELSDSLSAGDFASGAFNNQLAFRVEFTGGKTPDQSQLYWRVKTMPLEVNSFQWTVVEPTISDFSKSKEIREKLPRSPAGLWQYQILHERSKDNYLPYLDYVANPNKGQPLPDYSVYLNQPEPSDFSYNGDSLATSTADYASPKTLPPLLQLTTAPSAKMQLQMAKWREGTSSDMEIVQRVYKHFNGSPFEYTLTPRALDEFQPFDDFMLNSRSGYCEHYASAFTIIMRSMGIPSRVVVGYQGGTSVAGGQYIEVRYSDAHAWSEVWIDGTWQRVDPTAAISPERVKFGMEALMELWDSGALGSNNTGLALESLLNPTGITKTLRQLRDNWKNIGYQWNKWIVNYDVNSQRQLLENLGIKSKNTLAALATVMMLSALIVMSFYFWQLIPKRVKRDPIQTHYLKFLAKFKRFNILKTDSETPLEFSLRMKEIFADNTTQIDEITHRYNRLRYSIADENYRENSAKFKSLVKRFKPKLQKSKAKQST